MNLKPGDKVRIILDEEPFKAGDELTVVEKWDMGYRVTDGNATKAIYGCMLEDIPQIPRTPDIHDSLRRIVRIIEEHPSDYGAIYGFLKGWFGALRFD